MKLTIRLTEDEAGRLRALAFAAGCKSVNDYIRSLTCDTPSNTTVVTASATKLTAQVESAPSSATIDKPAVARDPNAPALPKGTYLRNVPSVVGRR